MKNFFNKIKNAFPKGATGVVFVGIILLAIIGAFFVYRAMDGFISRMTIAKLPGVPVLKDPTQAPVDVNNPEPSPDLEVNFEEPVDLDTFVMPDTWDGKKRVNILIMGIDARSPDVKAPLTDSMILFTLDPVANTAAMLSIPRDLWVRIPGSGYNKINTAYSIGVINQLPGGGPAMASKTVENFLGVSIDYYAQIDFKAFVDFINLIDGVKLNVTETVLLDVLDTQISFDLEPGIYTLDGDLALAYVRSRAYGDGDVSRAARQQQVILAVRDRILEFSMIPTLLGNANQIYDSLSRGIHTNLSMNEMIKLGLKILNDVPRDQIQHKVIDFSYVNIGQGPGGESMLRPLPNRIRELRDELFTGSTFLDTLAKEEDIQTILTEEGARVSVMNASSQADLGDRAVAYLRSQGVNVVEQGNVSSSTFSTITFYGAKPYTIKFLTQLTNITNPALVAYAYNGGNPVDIVIILGDDFANNNTLP
ncbi:MAG TPA: LCP family protein [Anaerolineaceae bacterium]|nr:LCP family protein [Anaerolineaceae bacterium]